MSGNHKRQQNPISVTHPNLLLEWNYIKNNNFNPEKLTSGSNYKVWWKCSNDHEWIASIIQRAKGSKCQICYGKNIKHDVQYVKEFFLKYDQKLLSEEYNRLNQKLDIQCNVCKFFYKKSFHVFKHKPVCPRCAGFSKYSYDDVKEIVGKDGNILLSTEFINIREKMSFKCGSCSHIRNISLISYLLTKNCTNCAGTRRLTDDELKKKVESFEDTLVEFPTESNFLTSQEIKMKCNKCNKNYYIIASSYLRGHRCQYCAGNKKYEVEDLRKIVEGKGDNLIKYNNDGTRGEVSIKCNVCNYIFDMKLGSYLKNHRRCKCRISQGEKKIINYFEENEYTFVTQKTFKDCKHIKTLPFDFFVNNKLLIEYDGKQHFEKISHFDDDTDFEMRQKKDILKTKYCVENGITLLRISYLEHDRINEILSKVCEKDITNKLILSNRKIYDFLGVGDDLILEV